MSKMSQLHLELSEQAYELGFKSIEEAEACGYMVVYLEDRAELLPRDPLEQLNEAYKEWLKEKEKILEEQKELHDHLMELGYDNLAESVWHAITFIKERCHD